MKKRSFSKRKRIVIGVLLAVFGAVLLGVGLICGINAYVKHSGVERIVSVEEASELADVDCILVLGCLVHGEQPSVMLNDRLTRCLELYEAGVAPKLLMSGDHGTTEYDEVNTMKQYAVDAGVPSSDIFMDHAGFSTYESIYRAKEIFGADKMIIVTQEYHLYRALYIAEQLGVEAYGVASDYHTYRGQDARDAREVLARCKDAVFTVFKPDPTYLGEAIPISGDGDITNDKE